MIWPSLSELCSQRLRLERSDASTASKILNNQSTDIRVAAAISRYWKQQGYNVSVIADQGPIRSNLRYGLPPAYRREDAIRLPHLVQGAD